MIWAQFQPEWSVSILAPPLGIDLAVPMYVGYVFFEAARNFREAQKLEEAHLGAKGCAMCYFGEALMFGPQMNIPFTSVRDTHNRSSPNQLFLLFLLLLILLLRILSISLPPNRTTNPATL
jgi:hypothetical protein